MALSDHVRRLLASKTGAPPPADLPPEEPQETKPEATEEQQGFRDRAKREDERFRLATDGEFWLAFCFRTPAARDAFAAAVGVPLEGRTGQYMSGPRVEQALAHLPPADPKTRAKRMLTARTVDDTTALEASQLPDPLDGLGETGDLQADIRAEATRLLAALTAPQNPAPSRVLDSPHWVLACWPARDPKEAWLAHTGLDVLGDKYLDGHQAAKILQLTI